MTKNILKGKTALLIIDMQNDYFEGGNHALYKPLEALDNAKTVLEQFRSEEMPIIHVQHINDINEGFFEESTFGAEIHKSLTPLEDEIVIVKKHPDSFKETNLNDILEAGSITKLVVVGMQTNVCVLSTIKACLGRNLQAILLEDACAAINQETHEETIKSMREMVTVTSTMELTL